MCHADSKQSRLLATHCVVCGKPLTDARSVELGIGPVCRKGAMGHVTEAARQEANQLIYDASALYGESATEADVEDILKIADRLDFLGVHNVGDKIRERFIRIRLVVVDDQPVYRWNRDTRSEDPTGETTWVVRVYTPYDPDFTRSIKRMPYKRPVKGGGRFYWEVKREDSRQLLGVLADHFEGQVAVGPKGGFTIPTRQEYLDRFATPRTVEVPEGDNPPGTDPNDDKPAQPRGSAPVVTFNLKAYRRKRRQANARS